MPFTVAHLEWTAVLFCILNNGILANQWAVKDFEKKLCVLISFHISSLLVSMGTEIKGELSHVQSLAGQEESLACDIR